MAEITAERQAETRIESTQVGLGYNMRKNAEAESQYVIRVSDKLRTENQAQLEQTGKIAVEQREAILDEEVKALISQESSFAPDPSTDNLPEPQLLFLGTSSMKPT